MRVSFNLFILVAIIAILIINFKSLLRNVQDDLKDSFYNFTELTRLHGYLTEEHSVTTEDGYQLTVFRIARGKLCKGKNKHRPLLLMHGLLQSSDVFLDAGPDAGLAYLLADACYDIWIGNARGNYYARKHIDLNPDVDEKFWDFSIDEIGYYDLPAIIDYILSFTGTSKLNYVGYSQGGCAILIMCSEKPKYCNKLGVAISLAPPVAMFNSRSISMRSFIQIIRKFEDTLNYFGIYELFPRGGFLQSLLELICDSEINFLKNAICENIFIVLDSYSYKSKDDKTIPLAFKHYSAGTSVKNVARYGQVAKSGLFRKYDYGATKNIEKYGSVNPPEYNLRSIIIPVIVFQGLNDYMVDIKDSQWAVKEMSNAELFVLEDPYWNHFDFVYSQHVNTTLFPKLHEYLAKYDFDSK